MVKGMDNSKVPVERFRSYGIEASVWENEGKLSVSIRKRYKDEGGDYHDTTTFFQDDLPRLILVAQKAFEFIALADD